MTAPGRQPTANPTERFTIGYGVAFGLLLASVGPTVPGLVATGVNLLLAGAAYRYLPRLRASAVGPIAFLGDTLPLLVFYLFYRECALVLNQPGVVWRDSVFKAFEPAALDAIPTGNLSMGEWLAFGYMAYVPLLLLSAAVLGQRDSARRDAQRMIRQICYAWGACYAVFVLFPVLGPRLVNPAFQGTRMGTGPFSELALANQRWGMLRGASFPSAHVAATAVALIAIRGGRAFWSLLPLGALIPIAAVYLGYHYVTDVAVGAATGAVAVALDRLSTSRAGDSRP